MTQDITKDDFKLYLSGALEHTLDDTHTDQSLILKIKEATKSFNKIYGTDLKPPRYKAPSKRVKRCSHCQGWFLDTSRKNQVLTCHRGFAYDSKGKAMYRNGVKLTYCYQQYSNGKRREDLYYPEYPTTFNSTGTDAWNRATFSSMANIDERGNEVKTGRVRTQSREDTPDYGAFGGSIKFPDEQQRNGIFDEFGNVKDRTKFDALPQYLKERYLPKVHTIQLFYYDWHELDDEYKRLYKSESEFNQLKEKHKKRGA